MLSEEYVRRYRQVIRESLQRYGPDAPFELTCADKAILQALDFVLEESGEVRPEDAPAPIR